MNTFNVLLLEINRQMMSVCRPSLKSFHTEEPGRFTRTVYLVESVGAKSRHNLNTPHHRNDRFKIQQDFRRDLG